MVLGAVGEFAEGVDDGLVSGLVVGFSARAAVDDGDLEFGGGLEGLLHLRGILRGLLHRENRKLVLPAQFFNARGDLFASTKPGYFAK